MRSGKAKDQQRAHSPRTTLEKFFNERIATKGMTQEAFGHEYNIGSQSIVWQYLSGHRKLGAQMAARFAMAFGCTIAELDPRLADKFAEMASEILPVLGKKLEGAPLADKARTSLVHLHETIAGTGDERELLRAFRNMTSVGKQRMLEQARMLLREYAIDSKVLTMHDPHSKRKQT